MVVAVYFGAAISRTDCGRDMSEESWCEMLFFAGVPTVSATTKGKGSVTVIGQLCFSQVAESDKKKMELLPLTISVNMPKMLECVMWCCWVVSFWCDVIGFGEGLMPVMDYVNLSDF